MFFFHVFLNKLTLKTDVACIISYMYLNNSFHLTHHEQNLPIRHSSSRKPAYTWNSNLKKKHMFLPHIYQNAYQKKLFKWVFFYDKTLYMSTVNSDLNGNIYPF